MLLRGGALVGIVALTAVMVVIGLESPIVDRAATFVALRTVFCVGVVAIALVLLARGMARRLAGLLIVIGYAIAIAGLTAVDSPIPFAVGRLAIPVAILSTVYFCLAYPSGRIEDRAAFVTFAATATVVVVLDAANVLLSDIPPVAGPLVRCAGSACPENPFNVVSLGVGASRTLSSSLGLATTLAVFSAAVLTGRRAAQATRLQRRSLAPLFAWTILTALAYGSFVGVRAVDEHQRALDPGAVVVAAVIAALPFAIALGIARGRLFAMRALEEMIAALGTHPTLIAMQRTMARAFGDPTLRLLFWRPNVQAYAGVDGDVVGLDTIPQGRALTEFTRSDEKVAAVMHDAVLVVDRDLLETAGRALDFALMNAGLERELSSSVEQLEISRRRLAQAADEERRRIEQDLHDGAQQDLIGLRIKLSLLEAAARDEGSSVVLGLVDAGRRVDSAIAQVRDLARGIYPGLLRDFGLAEALAAIARDMPLEVSVHADTRRRFAPEVETAVYFCCVEALQNVAKHCGAGTAVSLRVAERRDGVRFVVADRGPGFDPALSTDSRGITGMRDRLEAIGGELKIRSSPGSGTTVSGSAPGDAV